MTIDDLITEEVTIVRVVEAYIKNEPHGRKGPVTLKSWFQAYDIKTGKCLGRGNIGQGHKHYNRWRRNTQNIEFDEWIKQQLPAKIAKQLEQTPYCQQKEYSIEVIVKAYTKHKPQSKMGPVPLQNWFSGYDIKTGDYLGRGKSGPGSKYIQRWRKENIEFGEWILRQVSEKLQNAYLQKIHGIEQGTDILRALECVMKPRPIQLDLLRSDSVKRMLTAYYIERDLHPEIKSFSPYQTMLYLNTKPEERQQMRA